MERTESIVIQVAPSYENARIQEMAMFQWNLQGRQEIHEAGDAYGRESIVGNSYVIKQRVSKYVKLHFVRSMEVPNLDAIKQVESEYFNLPFPEPPVSKSYLWPLFFIFCGIVSLSNNKSADALNGFLVCAGIGILWLYLKIKKRNTNIAVCMQSQKRQEELINQLQSLERN